MSFPSVDPNTVLGVCMAATLRPNCFASIDSNPL